jgi:chromate transport protein ChrA
MATSTHASTYSNLLITARNYADLGFISFGGPGVHVVILKTRFVDQLRWLDEKTFIDLFSLGNALPGPGSTQLAFSIAVVCHGIAAGILAFALWSIPGALGMAGLAGGVTRIPDTLPPIVLALLTGFNAAAVGLIALAALQLGSAASTDELTTVIVWLSASFGICYHAPWMYPVLITIGGVTTLCWDQRRIWLAGLTRFRIRRRGEESPSVQTDTEREGIAMRNDELPSIGHRRLDTRPTEEENQQDLGTALAQASFTRRNVNTPHSDSARHSSTISGGSSLVLDEPLATAPNLKVIPVKAAIALASAFVLLLIVPLATRAGYRSADREVPRALDVCPKREGAKHSSSLT